MKKFFILTSMILTLALPINAFAFTDLNEGDKYSDAIFFLEERGILEGYPDGEVKVNQSVNRAEFLKMVLEYNEEPIGNETGCFEDVKGNWAENYICYAQNKGWVNGYDPEHFIPSREVNFAEAAKIITNVVFSDYILDQPEENEDWFYGYVDFLDEREVDVCEINSYDEFLTRGMVAELLYQVETNQNLSQWDLNSGKCVSIGASYEDLGMDYYKYRGDVYFKTPYSKRLYIADFDSFERIHEHYGKDKYRVYLGENVVEGANPEFFEVLHYIYSSDRAYAVDKNNVYYGTTVLEDVDVNSFEFINSNFIKDINGVYYQDNWSHEPLQKIAGADPSTFELLQDSFRYGKDKNSIYYGTRFIEGADSATIELIGSDYSNFYYANQYAKDKNYVYCGDDIASETDNIKILEGANPDTFVLVNIDDDRLEGRDGDKVYENCELVE